MKNEMEELFADLCQGPRLARKRTAFRPRVDVYRSEEPPAITVIVELPGVDPDGVEVAVSDGTLSISGTRRREAGGRRVYQHIEMDYGPFERRIPLSERIDPGGIQATYNSGLLTVVLPVATPRSGRVRIQVARREAS